MFCKGVQTFQSRSGACGPSPHGRQAVSAVEHRAREPAEPAALPGVLAVDHRLLSVWQGFDSTLTWPGAAQMAHLSGSAAQLKPDLSKPCCWCSPAHARAARLMHMAQALCGLALSQALLAERLSECTLDTRGQVCLYRGYKDHSQDHHTRL